MTTKSIAAAILAGLAISLAAAPAFADAPSLEVAPLQYTGTLKQDQVQSGFVDVSNPTDTTILITSSVQRFRQTGTDGDLVFSDDARLASGINVSLGTFTLGPREAVRVAFSVDPSKLPQGGVYAAIFFRTQPVNQTANSDSSYVTQSANVGTLLMLTNGGPDAHRGRIAGLTLPIWQLGSGLYGGTVIYNNPDTTAAAVGYDPKLTTSVVPWGHAASLTTGLVLPGVTRKFAFSCTGAFFGLLPVTITDNDTGLHRTVWVFALTGYYHWLVPLLLLLVIGLAFLLRRLRLELKLPRRLGGQPGTVPPVDPHTRLEPAAESVTVLVSPEAPPPLTQEPVHDAVNVPVTVMEADSSADPPHTSDPPDSQSHKVIVETPAASPKPISRELKNHPQRRFKRHRLG